MGPPGDSTEDSTDASDGARAEIVDKENIASSINSASVQKTQIPQTNHLSEDSPSKCVRFADEDHQGVLAHMFLVESYKKVGKD